jgi:hypothetical protein
VRTRITTRRLGPAALDRLCYRAARCGPRARATITGRATPGRVTSACRAGSAADAPGNRQARPARGGQE